MDPHRPQPAEPQLSGSPQQHLLLCPPSRYIPPASCHTIQTSPCRLCHLLLASFPIPPILPHPPAHHHLRNPPGWGHRQWCSYKDQQTAPSPHPRQVILLMGSRAPNHGENGKKGFLHSRIRSLCVLPLDEAKTLRNSVSCSQAGAQTHQSRLFLHFCSKTQQRPLILRIPKASWLTVYFKRIPESTHFKAYDLSSLRLRTGFTVC